MTRAKGVVVGAGVALAIVVTAVTVLLIERREPERERLVSGAVLTADTNPQRQRPIAEARVTIVSDVSTAVGTTDEAGLFRLTIAPPFRWTSRSPSRSSTRTTTRSRRAT